MSDAPKQTYFIAIVGRGVLYGGMAQTTSLERLAGELQHSVNSGFEVYVYSLEPSPAGNNILFPPSILALKREYHLFDGRDDFVELADSIIERSQQHSLVASLEYVKLATGKLLAEQAKLEELITEQGLRPVNQTDDN